MPVPNGFTPRRFHRAVVCAGLFGVGLMGCAANTPTPLAPGEPGNPIPKIRLQSVATGLPEITAITHAGDGSGRLFLTTQRGRVLVVNNGELLTEPLLDISNHVRCCAEQGLLGIAFDPHFKRNGRFYLSYIDREGSSTIQRFHVHETGQVAEETVLLSIPQPTPIHNGGAITFGPDGFLYVAIGDGGHYDANAPDNSGRDPDNHGQRLDTLLGKILRLDVSDSGPYSIPITNPYRQTPNARPEIWANGLRNPWRMSFDRQTGDLFVADVGPSQWEEINRAPRGTGGLNFGWSAMLGPDCFTEFRCDSTRYTAPILMYDHNQGCAVIGGFRYRGHRLGRLSGHYLYTDFCTGSLYSGRELPDGSWQARFLLSTGLRISTFGEDEAGEIYLVNYSPENGALYRLEPASPR